MNDAPGAAPAAAFNRYAAWYDVFNQGKDYDAEARYVLDKARAWRPQARTWLDIGCGTGAHLESLRAMGLQVEGVDLSPEMIEEARRAHPAIAFHVATAQDFALQAGRDVVSMLFHVLSYQTTDDAVGQALKNIAGHLAVGGVFVFDFWHTEGVLRDPPAVRVRETRVEGRPLFRIANPTWDRTHNRVEIGFQFRWDARDGPLAHEEHHSMRYFAQDELAGLLEGAGLSLVACEGWMRHRALLPEDWYGLGCAIKLKNA